MFFSRPEYLDVNDLGNCQLSQLQPERTGNNKNKDSMYFIRDPHTVQQKQKQK